MAVRIRPLEARDQGAWRELFKGYIAFYKATVADDVIDETFRRLLSGAEHVHRGLVAVDETDTPIGLAHILFHRSTWTTTWYCYLEDLFVRPDVRAKGVGEALIQAVYAAADARGTTRLYWTTQEFNYRARGLYDKVATKSPFIQYRRLSRFSETRQGWQRRRAQADRLETRAHAVGRQQACNGGFDDVGLSRVCRDQARRSFGDAEPAQEIGLDDGSIDREVMVHRKPRDGGEIDLDGQVRFARRCQRVLETMISDGLKGVPAGAGTLIAIVDEKSSGRVGRGEHRRDRVE
jgi:GNAT superfamily N-acetyltransferase